jgi:predicted GTPase
MSTIERQALGRIASLGSFYDARNDQILPYSIVSGQIPEEAIVRMDNHRTDTELFHGNSFSKKFSKLQVDADLGASFLAGSVSVNGSGNYLHSTSESQKNVEINLHHDVSTVHERLDFQHRRLRTVLNLDSLHKASCSVGAGPTHFVAEIYWGARCIITAIEKRGSTNTFDEKKGNLDTKLRELKFLATAHVKGNGTAKGQGRNTTAETKITIRADILASGEPLVSDWQGALALMNKVPTFIKAANGGKGKQLSFKLVPIGFLLAIFGQPVLQHQIICRLEVAGLADFIDHFDEVQLTRLRSHDDLIYAERHHDILGPDIVEQAKNAVRNAKQTETQMRESFRAKLTAVRSGHVGPDELGQLLIDQRSAFRTSGSVKSVINEDMRGFVDFITRAIGSGAEYVTGRLIDALLGSPEEDTYILYTNEANREDLNKWEALQTTFVELCERSDSEPQTGRLLIYDCGRKGIELSQGRIELRRGRRVIRRDITPDRCTVRCDHTNFEWTDSKPLKRRLVEVPCPGLYCPKDTRQWHCEHCSALLEYGYADGFIYCGCGRANTQHYRFQCDSQQHGVRYSPYDQKILASHLSKLEDVQEVNLLILGETGVGKSTFINALLNYLNFETLRAAMEGEFHCAIKASFDFYLQDPDEDDWTCNHITVKPNVAIGPTPDGDELDGANGDSATQRTQVYILRTNNMILRLIDTPGIGDTRGIEQDAKNMQGLLDRLRSVDKLHGILILLKPNNSRLDVVFKFCIKELLTLLHRDAAKNLTFCFTNAQNTAFGPGATLGLLKRLVAEHREVSNEEIVVNRHTTYYFDSASFQFLAAAHQGVDVTKADHIGYHESIWNRSAKEASRLIAHLTSSSVTPHHVKNTTDLNDTKALVRRMTVPLIEIVQTIAGDLDKLSFEKADLEMAIARGDDIKAQMWFDQTVADLVRMERPRTVCTHEDCVEVRDQMKHYRKPCHDPCTLQNLKLEEVDVPAIQLCVAFQTDDDDDKPGMLHDLCQKCGHHWEMHKHTVFTLEQKTVRKVDQIMKAAFDKNLGRVAMGEAKVQSTQKRIDEFTLERTKIQRGAGMFSAYIKQEALQPMNDSKLGYLDWLINEEKKIVGQYAVSHKLTRLQEDRVQHNEEIDRWNKYLSSDPSAPRLTQAEVRSEISQLYDLPHFGANIRDFVEKITQIEQDSMTPDVELQPRRSTQWKSRARTRATDIQRRQAGNSDDIRGAQGQSTQHRKDSDQSESSVKKGLWSRLSLRAR